MPTSMLLSNVTLTLLVLRPVRNKRLLWLLNTSRYPGKHLNIAQNPITVLKVL